MQLTFTIDGQTTSDTLTQQDIIALEHYAGQSFHKLADDVRMEYIFFLCWRLWRRKTAPWYARRMAFDQFVKRYEISTLHFDAAEPDTNNIDQIVDEWRNQW